VGLGDPCAYWLTRPNATGLAIDAPNPHFKKLYKNYPSARVFKKASYVNPDTIEAVFAEAAVPRDIFVYKIDIDAYDTDITQKVLELGYRPRFIYVEHAHNFPPGFWFKVRYEPNRTFWWSSRDQVFGNSVTAWHAMIRQHGKGEYLLLGMKGNDMLWGHRSVVATPSGSAAHSADDAPAPWEPSLKCAYDEGFLNRTAWSHTPGGILAIPEEMSWWTADKVPRRTRLEGMMRHVNGSRTMKHCVVVTWNGPKYMRHQLYRHPMPAPGGPRTSGSKHVTMLPYPVELRLDGDDVDDGRVPLRGACAIDSCAMGRISLASSRKGAAL